MNKIQSAPISSTLHHYSTFIVVYSTPPLSLPLALHLSLTLACLLTHLPFLLIILSGKSVLLLAADIPAGQDVGVAEA